ncbi:MAG TPA: NAD-dependent epimerase/dehydratase family protein [Chthoniobacterales bacterium]|nr:NAD-dependent epimerase/dehydratase family protein [Chthoniobacterales bacterium]
MPRVLIAGCGYVGVATAELFRDRGWEVEGWTASPESARALGGKRFPVRAVDISDPHAVASAASGFDAVIQSVSSRGGTANVYRRIYKEGAKNLATACSGSPLLFISSTSVYGQTSGEWVSETSIAEPARETGRVLRETEKFVLEQGGAVARVAGIYGPARSSLLRKFLDGTARITGTGDRFINQVHRDDVAAALFVLMQNHLASKEAQDSSKPCIFNVSDNHPLTERECYAALAAHFAGEMPPSATASVDRKRGNTNKRVSSEKLQRLGWRPRFPDFPTGLRESVAPEAQDSGK